jgi:isocitrate dehydrogenase kinase/phosphatase
VALKNTDDGIVADAVIMRTDDASMVFGFTRSYFHADIGNVSAAIGFLRTLLPRKPLAELYIVLGRAKQGKTERYRAFFQHLSQSDDLFIHAKGDKGMVMEVFTLPSFDIVFKIIRDRFAYPKTIGRKEVMEKYELVFKHDRAGRLVDAQEFKRLRFPLQRFEPSLLEDLLSECSETCRIEGDDFVVEHCYVERRLTPLNLYLEDAPEDAARAAAIEYGQSIRDLAMSNIFAGDLLLKNFGVTRHGRVIFYDYDELCLVTECNFRRMPEPRDEMDEMRAGAWFYVGPNDVFPEQFIEFLGFKPAARQAFMDYHSDLLAPAFWTRLKRRFEAGEIIDVLPYTTPNWTEHRGTTLVPARSQSAIRNESV